MNRNRWDRSTLWLLVVGLWLAGACSAAVAAESHGALHPSMSVWEPYLGTWEIDATWSGGQPLWSRGVYEPAMDGRFVRVKTYVRDGDGPVYLRYDSMIGAGDEPGTFTIHNFIYDGKIQRADYSVGESGSLHTRWSSGESEIKERLDSLSPTEIRWQVWAGKAGAEDWTRLMDGTWHKIDGDGETTGDKEASTDATSAGTAGSRPIDASLFVASGPEVRGFELEETMAVPPADVFAAFTDADAFVAAYGPQSETLKAAVELAIGGRYEWLFDGEVGSNGCQVLAYAPGRMVAFTWSAPPEHGALRDVRTWVVVQLDPTPEGTAVRLGHWGFGDGAEWDDTVTYFKNAWAYVLGTLKNNLEATD